MTGKRDSLFKSPRIIALLVLFILGIVVAVVVIIASLSSNTAPQESAAPQATEVARTVSGELPEVDKKAALARATELLNLAAGPDDADAFAAKIEKLDSGDFTDMPPELQEKIRFQDTFTDEGLQINTYQALVTFSALINRANEAPEAEPLTDDAWEAVYLDSTVGIAYVPLSVFLGTQTSFSLEFVYVEGEWLLSPYSLLEQVRLSAGLTPQE